MRFRDAMQEQDDIAAVQREPCEHRRRPLTEAERPAAVISYRLHDPEAATGLRQRQRRAGLCQIRLVTARRHTAHRDAGRRPGGVHPVPFAHVLVPGGERAQQIGGQRLFRLAEGTGDDLDDVIAKPGRG